MRQVDGIEPGVGKIVLARAAPTEPLERRSEQPDAAARALQRAEGHVIIAKIGAGEPRERLRIRHVRGIAPPEEIQKPGCVAPLGHPGHCTTSSVTTARGWPAGSPRSPKDPV